MPYTNKHFKDKCCDADLNEKEIKFLDNFPSADSLTEYELCEYIAPKSNIGLDAPQTAKHLKDSEFTRNVSRRLLKHPRTTC